MIKSTKVYFSNAIFTYFFLLSVVILYEVKYRLKNKTYLSFHFYFTLLHLLHPLPQQPLLYSSHPSIFSSCFFNAFTTCIEQKSLIKN